MKIAITGHRPNKLGNDYDLTSPLLLTIKARIMMLLQEKLTEDNTIYAIKHQLISGMALGIDTLFAKIAIEMCIPFIAAIPCWNQDKMWPAKSKEIYGNILASKLCTIYQVTASEYTPQCMQTRNKWMVDNCDILIAIWDGSSGGTANCVKYAQSVGREIITINPKQCV